jgi:hypothetical protein
MIEKIEGIFRGFIPEKQSPLVKDSVSFPLFPNSFFSVA